MKNGKIKVTTLQQVREARGQRWKTIDTYTDLISYERYYDSYVKEHLQDEQRFRFGNATPLVNENPFSNGCERSVILFKYVESEGV